MSVGVGQCQNEICGNCCLQSQWLASVTAHPLTTASLKPGARFPNQIRVLFVLCAAATRWMMGQNWRKPFHTSREGGCKDKGGDVVRMASITINHNTALGAQRTCHRFCLFELQLLLLIYKETSTSVTTRKLQCSFFDKWLTPDFGMGQKNFPHYKSSCIAIWHLITTLENGNGWPGKIEEDYLRQKPLELFE